MKKCINEMLNLQGVLTDKIEVLNEEKKILVYCRGARRAAPCPACGAIAKKIHQTKSRMVRHGIMNYRQLFLVLKTRRFKCRCGKVFTEELSGIDRRRSSANCIMQMVDWLRRNSFNFIGEQFGVSPSSLVRYVVKMSEAVKIDWKTEKITKLGIDEHSFRGRHLVITITDLSNRKLLAVLKSDRKTELIRFIERIPREYRVKIDEVCTDLKFSYRAVVEKLLPNAILTADRFHVESLSRRALDDIRSVVQEEGSGRKQNLKQILWNNYDQLDDREKIKLESAFKRYERYPVLKQAWLVKEKIIEMYRQYSEVEAEKKFRHVIMLLETSDDSRYLSALRRTLKRWKRQILNYFKNKTTNGFTEGCHTKIKMIKRVSYGFKNINNYIAKITLAFLPLIWILNYHTI